MNDTVTRFSNRVANYAKYRPGYPPEVLDLFRNEMGLTKDSIVADIGSGTGLSTKPFLENANTVYGVQLNRQLSRTPCTEGYTWGYDRNAIWVDRGCRAEFLVQ